MTGNTEVLPSQPLAAAVASAAARPSPVAVAPATWTEPSSNDMATWRPPAKMQRREGAADVSLGRLEGLPLSASLPASLPLSSLAGSGSQYTQHPQHTQQGGGQILPPYPQQSFTQHSHRAAASHWEAGARRHESAVYPSALMSPDGNVTSSALLSPPPLPLPLMDMAPPPPPPDNMTPPPPLPPSAEWRPDLRMQQWQNTYPRGPPGL